MRAINDKFGWIILLLILFVCTEMQAQQKKVLFIGNSYTGANNLPQMLVDVANSTGDTISEDRITPGGFRLLNHSSNAATLAKIASDNWDYVILQAQSQEPSWPLSQVQQEVFPHATILCDSITANNSCSRPIFYMTWGRKNGDASNCAGWPPVCTYEGMDSLLNERYQIMADDNDGLVAPVGAVWRKIRQDYPQIELYTADESHPSTAGTYAAACTFYATILRKDPKLITFDGGLLAAEAQNIRQATHDICYLDFLNWNVGKFDPKAEFSFSVVTPVVTFTNSSVNAEEYLWFFGDGDTSSLENPIHTYALPQDYYVTLDASKCGMFSSVTDTVTITTSTSIEQVLNGNQMTIFPNPVSDVFDVRLTGNNPSNSWIRIFDSSSKFCLEKLVNGDLMEVNTLGFSPGFYFVSLFQNGKVIETQSIQVIR